MLYATCEDISMKAYFRESIFRFRLLKFLLIMFSLWVCFPNPAFAGKWFGFFQQVSNTSDDYSHSGSIVEFKEKIEELWDEGYDLVSVAYGEGNWFGVFQGELKGSNAYSQMGSLQRFEKAIKQRREDGYDLISIAYGDGMWFGVFQRRKSNDYYSIISSNDKYKFVNKIGEEHYSGEVLSSIAYGDGYWFGVCRSSKPFGLFSVSEKNIEELKRKIRGSSGQLNSVAYVEKW